MDRRSAACKDGGSGTGGSLSTTFVRGDANPFVPPSWLISELRLEPDASESGPRFVRGDCNGDCNGDGSVSGNPTDAVFLLNFLFGGGREP